MTTETLRIEGMTCNHCVMAVRKALAGLEGIQVDDVQIGSATISYDKTDERTAAVDAAIAAAGFTVTSHE